MKEKGPSYSIKSTERGSGKRSVDVPGPGSYDGNVSVIKQNLGIISFTKEKRVNKAIHQNSKGPGPGTYDAPASQQKGVSYKFSQGSRTNKK